MGTINPFRTPKPMADYAKTKGAMHCLDYALEDFRANPTTLQLTELFARFEMVRTYIMISARHTGAMEDFDKKALDARIWALKQSNEL